ncbi:MAG TPA: hypothetical protein VHB25_20270 [Gemmatimonadaceae bacterium]|nr:hypothetical protein [Gemmatimonadaceae bacterium]
MRIAFRPLVAVCPLAVAFAVRLGAQEPRRLAQPDSVPYETTVALIAAYSYGTDPQLMIGGMPEWAAQRLYVPPNGRVLGSAYLGSTATAVISLPVGNDSAAMAEVRGEFARRGWTAPPTTSFGNGGFRPAALANIGRQPPTRISVCSGEYSLIADVRRHAGSALYLTYRLSNAPNGICHSPVRPPMPVAYTQPRFPTLYEPETINDGKGNTPCFPQTMPGGGGTASRFRTAMPRDRMLEYFGKQLADSGWTRLRDSVPVTVTSAWTRPDSTGAPQVLTLTISTPYGVTDAQCQEAQMNILPPKKP